MQKFCLQNRQKGTRFSPHVQQFIYSQWQFWIENTRWALLFIWSKAPMGKLRSQPLHGESPPVKLPQQWILLQVKIVANTEAGGPLAEAFYSSFLPHYIFFSQSRFLPLPKCRLPTMTALSPFFFFFNLRGDQNRGLFASTKHFFQRRETLLLVGCDAVQLSAVLVSTPFVFHCQRVLLCILHHISPSLTKDSCAG